MKSLASGRGANLLGSRRPREAFPADGRQHGFMATEDGLTLHVASTGLASASRNEAKTTRPGGREPAKAQLDDRRGSSWESRVAGRRLAQVEDIHPRVHSLWTHLLGGARSLYRDLPPESPQFGTCAPTKLDKIRNLYAGVRPHPPPPGVSISSWSPVLMPMVILLCSVRLAPPA